MEPFMRTAAAAAVVVVMGTTGCRLKPLTKDKPGASSHLLPPGTVVPNAIDNLDLKVQITLNDGLDDAAFAMSGGVVPRGTGMSAGAPVRFWSFGPVTRAPSPLYEFFQRTDAGLVPIDHPGLIDALPGDHGYGPLHGINQVVVTDAYDGELITTMAALADAIDLGLVEEPVPIKMFVDTPIVLPSAKLDVGGGNPQVVPETLYARGYTVTAFRFGGALGVQPTGTTVLPVSQVSFLRDPGKIYDAAHPVFQATIPTMPPPPMVTNYTPLSVVVNVDMAPGTPASTITRDSELFTRSATGDITGTTAAVAGFQITTSIQLLQLQFTDGMP
jgi:hypothetical protein